MIMEPEQANLGQNNTRQTQPSQVIPPSPPAEVGIRTMTSDVKSIQEQGGAVPIPEIITPSELEKNTPLFQVEASYAPQIAQVSPTSEVVLTPVKPKRGLGWLWAFLLLLILGGGGYGAYYYYQNFYLVKQENELENTPSLIEQPSPNIPTPTPNPTFNSNPGAIDLSSLIDALNKEAAQLPSDGSLKEVYLVNELNEPVSFSNLIVAVLPELANTETLEILKNNFESDFKVNLYYDDKGVWPIYRGKIKASAVLDLMTIKNKLGIIEYFHIDRFYLTSPGTVSVFKDAKVNTFPVRSVSFSQSGAMFSYGLIDEELIISTSDKGLVEMLSE